MSTENTADKITIKPWIWVSGSILLLASVGVFFWHRNKKKKEEQEESGSIEAYAMTQPSKPSSGRQNTPSKSGPFRCESRDYPLEYGTCHHEVVVLQRYLKSMNSDLGTSGVRKDGIDGKFGRMTERAAKAKTGKSSFSKKE